MTGRLVEGSLSEYAFERKVWADPDRTIAEIARLAAQEAPPRRAPKPPAPSQEWRYVAKLGTDNLPQDGFVQISPEFCIGGPIVVYNHMLSSVEQEDHHLYQLLAPGYAAKYLVGKFGFAKFLTPDQRHLLNTDRAERLLASDQKWTNPNQLRDELNKMADEVAATTPPPAAPVTAPARATRAEQLQAGGYTSVGQLRKNPDLAQGFKGRVCEFKDELDDPHVSPRACAVLSIDERGEVYAVYMAGNGVVFNPTRFGDRTWLRVVSSPAPDKMVLECVFLDEKLRTNSVIDDSQGQFDDAIQRCAQTQAQSSYDCVTDAARDALRGTGEPLAGLAALLRAGGVRQRFGNERMWNLRDSDLEPMLASVATIAAAIQAKWASQAASVQSNRGSHGPSLESLTLRLDASDGREHTPTPAQAAARADRAKTAEARRAATAAKLAEAEAILSRVGTDTAPTIIERYIEVPVAAPSEVPGGAANSLGYPLVSGTLDDGTPVSMAVTAKGDELECAWRIVDAADLVVSHLLPDYVANPEYPQEIQPRDRSRNTYRDQVATLARRLNPSLLMWSANVADGAPIVGPDLVVESGNGRCMALRVMYSNPEQYSEQIDRYLTTLQVWAGVLGVQPADVACPILVRVRLTEMDRAEFARVANTAGQQGMAAAEQAMADAERITPEMLRELVPNQPYNDNARFIKAFSEIVAGQQAAGQMFDERGQLSAQGKSRVSMAVFAYAYHDAGKQLISEMCEFEDSEIKHYGHALLLAAPHVAVMHGGALSGHYNPVYDPARSLSDGAGVVRTAQTLDLAPLVYLNRVRLPGEEFALPTMAREWVSCLYATGKSKAVRLGNAIGGYCALAMRQPVGQSGFGLVDPPEPIDLAGQAIAAELTGDHKTTPVQIATFGRNLPESVWRFLPEAWKRERAGDTQFGGQRPPKQEAPAAFTEFAEPDGPALFSNPHRNRPMVVRPSMFNRRGQDHGY